ncbi:MAG TPA: peroxiredoxin-like family protein [Stellaceae bacterium]|nr:peroxiredoxin-like family protein [Stellaceae bacterium]
MRLQARLDAFKAEFESGKPPYNIPRSVVETMHRATRELIQSGAARRARKAGETAPSFVLEDAEGKRVSSKALLATGALVVSFYRGLWCPYCNMELEALQAALPEFRRVGAHLVAISPQTAANSRKTAREKHLTFPVLSDRRNSVAAAFGVRFRCPDDLIEVYRSLNVDLPGFNGDPSWTLPMPARYVVEPDEMIVYAEVTPDYTRRPDPEDLIPVLKNSALSQKA